MQSVNPPPPFFETPGAPPIPWRQWFDGFETYLGAIGASRFRPERKKFCFYIHWGSAHAAACRTRAASVASAGGLRQAERQLDWRQDGGEAAGQTRPRRS
ncbi:hypothetical protein NDU88_000134 [Pleurodeles waltl]|uniref:Uncharacterized protein n=1 Tax=Pleurodeles waltl TaxID=8319 RepID=A0AAV7SVS0_PLEWA|nr:hypothetical protein NDU88_000134 [Pleurodeles waltl]